MDVKDLIQTTLEKFKSEHVARPVRPEDESKMQEYVEQLTSIIQDVVTAVGDGLQLSDLTALGKTVGPLIQLAASFHDYTGPDKRRFVVEAVWLAYRVADTYPDGKHNNVNIPVVWGSLERRVERSIVSFAAGMTVDAMYDRMKSCGEV